MKHTIIILITFILMLGMVYGAPPSSNPNFETTLTLQTIPFDEHLINTPKYIHTHVYEDATGIIYDNTDLSCFYHLYNNVGEHIKVDGTLLSYGVGLENIINESYFNQTGDYTILMWCYNTAETKGGFTQYSFMVIDTEKYSDIWTCPKNFNFLWLILVLAGFFIILSIWTNQNLFGVLGGFMIALSYLFIGACSPLLTMPIIVVGILIVMYFLTK